MLMNWLLVGVINLSVPLPVQQTDTVFSVGSARRIQVMNHTGQIRVRTWDRPEIEIKTDSRGEEPLAIETLGSTIRVRASSIVPFQAPSHRTRANRSMNMPVTPEGNSAMVSGQVDYEITLPAYLEVEVITVSSAVSVRGVEAGIRITLIDGEVDIDGGRDGVDVDLWKGSVVVSRTHGRLRLTNMSGDIRVQDGVGEVRAESVNGSIFMQGRFSDVEAGTQSESIVFRGPLEDGGRYRFTTHSGAINLTIPPSTNASLSLSAPPGNLRAAFPLPESNVLVGGIAEIFLGSGSAYVSAETNRGIIRLSREGG